MGNKILPAVSNIKKSRKKRNYNIIIKTGVLSLVAAIIIACSPGALAAGRDLIPMGGVVGISLRSEGVMVIDVPETTRDGKASSPAKTAGIIPGDIIVKIGRSSITSRADLKPALEKLKDGPVKVEIVRAEKHLALELVPHRNEAGGLELGISMRDGIVGIGTLTFYDPETGYYGALGHAINDTETGSLMPLKNGSISQAEVADVMIGEAGAPGQLYGVFDVDNAIGSVTMNSQAGMFGVLNKDFAPSSDAAMPSAAGSEIRVGPAKILSTVSGSDVKEYDIEISRIYTGSEAVGRSMMITVTDPALIAITGGIVQGMSGSPIIQNGKLIGAVTHVLVNNPKKGYGISIEKMLNIIYGPEALSNKAA